MSFKVIKVKDLIENPRGIVNSTEKTASTKIYKLHRIIDAAGITIGYPDEVELVIEIEELING